MSKKIIDDLLYENMRGLEIKMLDSMPKEEELSYKFSKSFEKKMKNLIKEEKRTPFMRDFAVYGKRAASILFIIVGISFAVTMSVEAYRLKFFKIITEVFEEFTSIRFESEDGITDTILETIYPSYIPEGFTMLEEDTDDYGSRIMYENADNEAIIYEQMLITNGQIIFDTEGIEIKTMQIQDQTINIFTNKGVSQIYWNDDVYIFILYSTVGEKETIKIAKSIFENK